jgi:hypothetical protein
MMGLIPISGKWGEPFLPIEKSDSVPISIPIRFEQRRILGDRHFECRRRYKTFQSASTDGRRMRDFSAISVFSLVARL